MGQFAALRLTPDQLQARVDAYFEHCTQSRDEKTLKSGDVKIRQEWPTMIGLAIWLGISKETLCQYINGEYPTEWLSKLSPDHELYGIDKDYITNGYSDTLARARSRVEQSTIMAAANGDMDNRIAQLLMHQWGYANKQDLDGSGTLTIKWSGVDPADAERYSK